MAVIRRFQDLIVWQKSHQLALQVYKVTKQFPKEETYVLTSQIRRAVISIGSNIVEGFNRKTVKDSLQFYNIATGSLHELEYQLLLARDLQYISNRDYDMLQISLTEVSKLLFSWSKSQRDNFF